MNRTLSFQVGGGLKRCISCLIPKLLACESGSLPDAVMILFGVFEATRSTMPIFLRTDYDTARLRLAARESKDAGQTRRLLALAAIYDGASRTEAAAVAGVTLQIARDWVLKLNAFGPDALIDDKGPRPNPILTDAHRAVLAQAIEDAPIPAIHGMVRWRVVDLVQWLSDDFRVAVSKQTLSRGLRQMGYHRLSARPRDHAQAAGAIDVSKKVSPRVWIRLGARRAPARAA